MGHFQKISPFRFLFDLALLPHFFPIPALGCPLFVPLFGAIKQCPHCGGALKIIAATLEKAAITKILDHLGLPVRVPPRAPAQIFDPFELT